MTSKEESLQRFKQNTQHSGSISEEPKQEATSSEVEELKKKLRMQDEKLKRIENARKREESIKNQEKVDLIKDDVSEDLFEKDYEYTAGGKKRHVHITLRPAMAYDQTIIAQRLADMSDGKSNYFDYGTLEYFNAVALFQTVGVGLPDTLTDLHKISRTDLVLEIFNDYGDWLTRFRDRQVL